MQEVVKHEIVVSNLDLDVKFFLSMKKEDNLMPHWHNSIEIIYTLDGVVNLKVENKEITLRSGDIYIINSSVIHSANSNENKSLVLQIPVTFLNKYIENYNCIYLEIDDRVEDIKNLFREMHEVYKQKNKARLLKFNSLLYNLLYILVNYCAKEVLNENIVKKDKYVNKIKQIMLYINKNHNKNIRIGDIADYFGYNRDYLSRLFKNYMNMSIIQYLYEVRVNYIYKDLLKLDMNVNQILERHGGFNYRVIMRVFKEKYHETPNRLRQKRLKMSE